MTPEILTLLVGGFDISNKGKRLTISKRFREVIAESSSLPDSKVYERWSVLLGGETTKRMSLALRSTLALEEAGVLPRTGERVGSGMFSRHIVEILGKKNPRLVDQELKRIEKQRRLDRNKRIARQAAEVTAQRLRQVATLYCEQCGQPLPAAGKYRSCFHCGQ